VQVAHLEFLQTKRGTKLLTSGWWGAARKINYTGMLPAICIVPGRLCSCSGRECPHCP
jgi:hypothetical protein